MHSNEGIAFEKQQSHSFIKLRLISRLLSTAPSDHANTNYKGLTICECALSFTFSAKQPHVGEKTPQWTTSEANKLFIYKKNAHTRSGAGLGSRTMGLLLWQYRLLQIVGRTSWIELKIKFCFFALFLAARHRVSAIWLLWLDLLFVGPFVSLIYVWHLYMNCELWVSSVCLHNNAELTINNPHKFRNLYKRIFAALSRAFVASIRSFHKVDIVPACSAHNGGHLFLRIGCPNYFFF